MPTLEGGHITFWVVAAHLLVELDKPMLEEQVDYIGVRSEILPEILPCHKSVPTLRGERGSESGEEVQ